MVADPASHSKLPNFGRLCCEFGIGGRGGICGWLAWVGAALAGQRAPMLNDWYLGKVNKKVIL